MLGSIGDDGSSEAAVAHGAMKMSQ
jgi:hypothetical protein